MNAHPIPVDRQVDIIDTLLMQSAKFVQIGAGRGIGFTEIMVSAGLGALTVIDPDTVSRENVGQSGHRISEIGQFKASIACARAREINPSVKVENFCCIASEVPNLRQVIAGASLLKIGIDNPAAQFKIADLALRAGTSALVCGTTGDNSQWFVAHVAPGGPPLRDLLPEAWRGLQEGYKAPAFFPSCRLHAESLNVQAARLALGLIHHQAGSTLPIAEIGAAFTRMPLVIGSNGWHEPSGFLTPACFLSGSPE